ncbi:MAG TPA: hypothetical protein V6D37_13265 [Candidatus Sericytochromatia bacterium]
MSILPNFLRSLALTIFLSFIAPIVLVAVLLACLAGIGYIPGFESVGQAGTTQLLQFLAVFGSGCPLQGLMVIGFVCGLVGALFDTYSLTRNQMLNDH